MSFSFKEKYEANIVKQMSYCSKCGKEIEEDANFCKHCGAKTENAPAELAPAREHIVWNRDRYQIEDEREFTGPVDIEKIYMYARSRNGSINVSTWEKSEYMVKLYIKMRGYTREEAELNMRELLTSFTDVTEGDEQQLKLEISHPALRVYYSVNVEVQLPQASKVRLDLKTSNGRINIRDLTGSTMKAKSSNGRLQLDNIKAKHVEADSSNGRIMVSGVDAEKLLLYTSNGRVEGYITTKETDIHTSNGKIVLDIKPQGSGKYNLKTSNGRVDLTLPDTLAYGYDVDLRTSQAKISVNLDDLEYTHSKKYHIKAHTKEMEDRESHIQLKVLSSNGKILVNS